VCYAQQKAPLAHFPQGCHIVRNRGMNYSLVGWIKYDEKQDRGHGEGDKLASSVWGCIVIAQTCCPSETYVDVSRDMEQVRGDFCYILLITRIFNKEDVKEAHRRVGVTFIKAGYASYSEAVVRVIGFPPMR
jgi:hypothetical protein